MVSTVGERAAYLNVLQNEGRGQGRLHNLWGPMPEGILGPVFKMSEEFQDETAEH